MLGSLYVFKFVLKDFFFLLVLPCLFYAFKFMTFTLLYLKSQFHSCLFNHSNTVNLSFIGKNKNTFLRYNEADEDFKPLEIDY